jgi:GDP-4-dehydro-6-deoxy-D-mannose reductase
MRILITGITGFAGGHLAEALAARGPVELFGLSRDGELPPALGFLTARVHLHRADLCDSTGLANLLKDIAPDQVYHLAGHADVGLSFRQPAQAWRDNLEATRCLYDAIAEGGGQPRILYVGSGLCYGAPRATDQVFTEESAFYPVHPYGASKAAADLLSYQYTRFPGLNIIRARPFNHIGPRQSPQFAVAHFAKQIAAIEKGQQEPIVATGDLSAQRDLTDVRDIASAYIAMMEHGATGEAYNVASEREQAMHDVLQRLLDLSRVRVEVRQQPQFTRASEPFTARVSTAKVRALTGWCPRYNLEQSLLDTLNYWRENG